MTAITKKEIQMKLKSKWIAALFGAVMGLAISAQALAQSTPSSAEGAVGKVVSVDGPHKRIQLDHQPIKSLGWPAMTMYFAVDAKVSLQGLNPGDEVVFSLARNSDGTWRITRIEHKGGKK
jgi:Cu/Ag efflux protein CusF